MNPLNSKIPYKFISILLVFTILLAEPFLFKSTFGNSTQFEEKDQYILRGTLGQPIIGKSYGGNMINHSGFWHSSRTENIKPV